MSFFNAIGSFISGGLNLLGQHSANKANAEEGAKNRQFQHDERIAQNEWNVQQWHSQNEYNTPAAQVRRLQEAGLNPRLAMEGAAQTGSAQSLPQQGNIPSGAQSQWQNPFGGFSSSISDIANSLKSLGEAKKLGIETDWLEDIYKEQLNGFILDNEAKSIINSVNKKWLDKKEAAAYQKIVEEHLNLAAQTHNEDAKYEQIRYMIEEIKSKIHLNKSQWQLFNKQVANFDERWQQEQKESNARIREHNASSAESYSRRDLNELEYEIRNSTKEIEKEFNQHNFDKGKSKIDNELDLLAEQYLSAKKNNDWFEIDRIISYTCNILHAGSHVAEAASSYVPMSAFKSNKAWREITDADGNVLQRIEQGMAERSGSYRGSRK